MVSFTTQGPAEIGSNMELSNDFAPEMNGTVIKVSNLKACVDSAPPRSISTEDETASFVSSLSDAPANGGQTFASTLKATSSSRDFRCKQWCRTKMYSDLIQEGLQFLGRKSDDVVMLFESPSTNSTETSFFNNSVFPVHDYPPSFGPAKMVMGPLRYSIMNGSTYPSFLCGAPPAGLLEHWERTVPSFRRPTFVNTISDDSTVYAYLPLEHIRVHLNDPYVHYHVAGKDAIHLMTQKSPKMISNTADHRPYIAKVTHSMASKGIFIIRSDEDEQKFQDFLKISGNPNFVVTELVDIHRNVSCHFFMHPNGEIIWCGSSENYRLANGNWSLDAIMLLDQQDELRDLQLPYAREVADYCLALGFWGFCGIDVLFDGNGTGYVVDVNPRTTGTCPALMVARLLEEEFGYRTGVMRRSSKYCFPGPAAQMLQAVEAYNGKGVGKIVMFSFYEYSPTRTIMNVAAYGNEGLAECYQALNSLVDPDLAAHCVSVKPFLAVEKN
jgi:hypothetical protein